MSGIHDYSDILNIPRPEPRFHHRMPASARAAQFAPFAALTGFSSLIDEAGRTTDEKQILDDREKERISNKLTKLNSEISSRPFVNVTCFIPDKRKSGGSYMTISGNLMKIDICEKQIVFTNGIKTDFDDIIEISRG